MQRVRRKSVIMFTIFLAFALVWSSAAFANEAAIPADMLNVSATSEKAFEKAVNAVDGDASSYWKSSDELPQSITLELSRPLTVTELHYTPKAGTGVIEQYEIAISTDGETFEKVSEGTWDASITETQSISVESDEPVIAVQLTALSSSDGVAAAAELSVSTSDNDVVEAYVNLLAAIEEGQETVRVTRLGNGAELVAEEKAALEAVLNEAVSAAENSANSADQDAEQTNHVKSAIEQFTEKARDVHLNYLNETIEQAKQIKASGEYADILASAVADAEQTAGDANAAINQIDAAISSLVNASVEADPERKWIGSWATAMHAPFGGDSEGFNNWTIRQIIYPTADGDHVRIRFSNVFGDRALTLDKVGVALSESGAKTVPGSHREVTFDGNTSVTIPAGQEIWSDPIAFEVTDDVPLAISTYVSKPTGPTTWHMRSMQTTYFAPTGDFTENTDAAPYRLEQDSWYWISGVEVAADDSNARVIVALGDSITDGAGGSANTNNRWPNHLNKLLSETYPDANIAVLNAGISGNRVLGNSDSQGESALNRLNRDVFSHAGVTDIILLEGINDIGNVDSLTAEQLIDGYKTIINQAHDKGIRVIGATLTPFRGFAEGYFSEDKELKRQAVNEWIRTTDLLDGVIDFDQIVEDPNNPGVMLPDYDSGDHLHPGDNGYIAMGENIDPALFDPSVEFEVPAEKPEEPAQPEEPAEEPKEEPVVEEPVDEEPANNDNQNEEDSSENEPVTEQPVQDDSKAPAPSEDADEEIVPDMPKTGLGGTSDGQSSAWIVAIVAAIVAVVAGGWFLRKRTA